MHCYPGQSYEPKTEPVEKEEKWYPEEERERLEQVYGYLNEGHFSDLVFEEKYEPYAVEPKFKWHFKRGRAWKLLNMENCYVSYVKTVNVSGKKSKRTAKNK